MNTADLVMLVREKMDDLVEPYLTSDLMILDALNRAQKEFTRSTYSTYVEAPTTVIADDPWITLPEELLIVKAATYNKKQIRVITMHELDIGYFRGEATMPMTSTRWTDWRNLTGVPRFLITDVGPGRLRLVPTPDAATVITDTTVLLEGYGIPAPMEINGADPNVPLQYVEDLSLGALFHLYNNQDTDLFNGGQSQMYFQLWRNLISDAQVALNTQVRVQQRGMRLPRGFAPAVPTMSALQLPTPQQQQARAAAPQGPQEG